MYGVARETLIKYSWTLIVFSTMLSTTYAQIDVKHNVTDIYGVIDTRNITHGVHQWAFHGKPGDKLLLVLTVKNNKRLQQGDFKLFGSEVAAIGCYALSNYDTSDNSQCMKLWNTRYMACQLYTISGDAQMSFKKRNEQQEMQIEYDAVDCDFSHATTTVEAITQTTSLKLATNHTTLVTATSSSSFLFPRNLQMIIPIVVVVSLLLALFIILIVCLRRNKRKPRNEEHREEDNIYEEIDVIPPDYDTRINQRSRTPTVVAEKDECAVAPSTVYHTITEKNIDREQNPVVNIVSPSLLPKNEKD